MQYTSSIIISVDALLPPMDEWTIKAPNPKCRLFFKIDLLKDFAALCLADFIEWRYIHSWLVFFRPACELLPPQTNYQYLCTIAPLPSLWPQPPPPHPTRYFHLSPTLFAWTNCPGRLVEGQDQRLMEQQRFVYWHDFSVVSPSRQIRITRKIFD